MIYIYIYNELINLYNLYYKIIRNKLCKLIHKFL